jgi:hypothetical protein
MTRPDHERGHNRRNQTEDGTRLDQVPAGGREATEEGRNLAHPVTTDRHRFVLRPDIACTRGPSGCT